MKPSPASTAPMKPLGVTVPAALAISGFGRTKLYDLIKNGTVKTKKFGTRTIVIYSSLEALFDEGAA